MGSEWFPLQYRDAAGWRAEGLPLTCASDKAAKYLDAVVAQLAMFGTDEQLGGLEGALAKAKEAEPNMFMLRVVDCSFEVSAVNTLKAPEVKKKIYSLQKESETLTLSKWEKDHLEAVAAQAENDLVGASVIWEDILNQHPKDMLALQSLFFANLTTGRRRGLRDCVTRVAHHHRPGDRYYGNIQGKLCFGYEQNQQMDQALQAGIRCLEATPRDIWGIHSMAHVYEETLQPDKGIELMQSRESDWTDNGRLNCHVWWHQALNYVQKGDHEQALQIYDNKVRPLAFETKMAFPLSDAAALLMRLDMGNEEVKAGLDLKDRWRELAQVGYEKMESVNNVFYDLHMLLAGLYGNDSVKTTRALDAVREQAALWVNGENKKCYNCWVASKVGVPLYEACVAFKERDFETAFGKLQPIRYDLQSLLSGSHAQVDLLEQMALRAAIGAGRRETAQQLLNERVSSATKTASGENGQDKTDPPMLNDRLMKTILAMH